MREHPTRHTVIAVLTGVAQVVVPILLGLIAFRFVFPAIPWPDISINLPSIPWPDIPWPSVDLPSMPWPDWQPPGWLRWIDDHAEYVAPILIALVVARHEIRRRSKQDQRRAQAQSQAPAPSKAPSKAQPQTQPQTQPQPPTQPTNEDDQSATVRAHDGAQRPRHQDVNQNS